ncbi:MAG: hypothetical protein GY772_18040, partial [bacterium]|nr:hypothetical protein [bacterium]
MQHVVSSADACTATLREERLQRLRAAHRLQSELNQLRWEDAQALLRIVLAEPDLRLPPEFALQLVRHRCRSACRSLDATAFFQAFWPLPPEAAGTPPELDPLTPRMQHLPVAVAEDAACDVLVRDTLYTLLRHHPPDEEMLVAFLSELYGLVRETTQARFPARRALQAQPSDSSLPSVAVGACGNAAPPEHPGVMLIETTLAALTATPAQCQALLTRTAESAAHGEHKNAQMARQLLTRGTLPWQR